MEKIRKKVTTFFYIRHIYSIWIRNIEDGTVLLRYYNPKRGSPWINIERPDTKWVFKGFSDVDVKATVVGHKPFVRLAAQPCTWPVDGVSGYLPGQLVALALHCC